MTYTLKIYLKRNDEINKLYGNNSYVEYKKNVPGSTYANALKYIPEKQIEKIEAVLVINQSETGAKYFECNGEKFVYKCKMSK